MKKAIIYGRVSTDDKQDYGRQVDDLNRYAKANKIQIVETFTEKISGTKKADQRKEYSRMIEYLKHNPDVKLILVTELTRFGRLGAETRLAIEKLAEQGVSIFFQDRNFYSLNENGKVNSDTMMIIGILCDIAKKEVETLKHRIVSGLRFSASNGGAISGKYQAFGFKSINKKLTVDEKEMKVVREIFKLYKSGLGCSQIAAHLNGKGVKTRFNMIIGDNETKTKNGYVKKGNDFSWSSGTILTMLNNRLYKGERWHKKELVTTFEPPIAPIEFDQVQTIMKGRKNRPIRIIKNDNYLKGIIKCGVCGQPYSMHKRKDNHDAAYKCMSKKLKYEKKAEQCISPSTNIERLLHSLYIITHKLILTNVKANGGNHIKDIESKIENIKIQLKNATNELTRFEAKLKRLYLDYNNGDINRSTYLDTKSDFESVIAKSEIQKVSLVENLSVLENQKKKPVKEFYTKNVFLQELRNVISKVTISNVSDKALIKRLKVPFTLGDAKKEITYTTNEMHILVTVDTYTGQKISYIISRYSKRMILLENNKFKLGMSTRSEDDFKFMPVYEPFFETIQKTIREKLNRPIEIRQRAA